MPSQLPGQRNTRLVITAVLAAIGLWLLWDFVPALIWAIIFAVATWPWYTRFVRWISRRDGRTIAAFAFTLLMGLAFLVPLGFFAFEAGRASLFLVHALPELEKSGLPVPAWVGHVPLLGGWLQRWWQANLADPHAASALLGRLDRGVAIDWIRTLGTQLARRSTVLVFTLIALFLVYRDGVRLARDIETLELRLLGPQGPRLGMQMVLAVRGTVNGLVLVGLSEGVLLGFSYAIAGLSYAPFFGAMTGVAAMIPFGAPLVFTVAALLLIVQDGVVAGIAVFAIGCVIVFVADHFIRPMLIGASVKLPFIWVLLGILGGLESFGLMGLFIGPAVMAVLIALWHEWVKAAHDSQIETPPTF